jgi:hypothetical protein
MAGFAAIRRGDALFFCRFTSSQPLGGGRKSLCLFLHTTVLGFLELKPFYCLLPVPSVELLNLDLFLYFGEIIKASNVDAVFAGVDARVAVCVNAALFAKPMLRCFSPELIGTNKIGTGQ